MGSPNDTRWTSSRPVVRNHLIFCCPTFRSSLDIQYLLLILTLKLGSPVMGVYCHDRQDKLELLSTGHRVYVLFRSLSRHQHTGFHLEYRAICGGEIKLKLGQEYEIMSPNFPEEYPTNSNCSWVVTSPPGYQVAFHFDQFEIERHDTCQYDFIEVRDGPRPGEKLYKLRVTCLKNHPQKCRFD